MIIVGVGIALLLWYQRQPAPPPAAVDNATAPPVRSPAGADGPRPAQAPGESAASAGGNAAAASAAVTLTGPGDVIADTILDRQGGLPAYRIRFDRQAVESAAPGGQVDLFLPQLDRTVTVVLEGVRDNRYARTIFGHLVDTEGRRRAYFTIGAESLHGTIETDRGTFHIEQQSTESAIVYDARHIDEPGPDDAIVRDDVPTQPR